MVETRAEPTRAPSALTLVPPPTLPNLSPTPVAPRDIIAYSQCDGKCDLPEATHIWVANADGSGARKIVDLGAAPSLSPDGLKVVFEFSDGIYVANRDGANRTRIVATTGAAVPEWSRDGKWIVFADRSGLRAGGRVVQKAAWSRVPEGAAVSGNIFIKLVAPDGTQLRTLTVGNHPTWSPDGKAIAFNTCVGSMCGIYRVNAEGGEPTRVTDDNGAIPNWSPDGKQISYQADVNGIKQLFVVNADGAGKKQLTSGNQLHVSATWSADGKSIYYRSPEAGSWDIWAINPDGSNPRKIYGDYPPVDWGDEKISASAATLPGDFFPTQAIIPTRTPPPTISGELPPIPSGLGGLAIVNRYVQELEIEIGGKFYRIQPHTRIAVHLPPGRQTYSAGVPGRGRLSGEIQVQLGKYLEVVFEE
ncbi:MAG: PD40 domain-containing protein [Chloroflexi bacterium]|nr:PD40 domain-containing protein [Chloroflexota bacterium]